MTITLTREQAQPEHEWHNLTSTELKVLWLAANNPAEFGEFLQAKLKEKNYGKTTEKVTLAKEE